MTTVLVPKSASLYAGSAATESLFGANMLFNRDVGPALDNYTTAIESLDVSTLRYPGGTISESMFDLANPNDNLQRYFDNSSLFDPDASGPLKPQTMGLDDFIAYCGDQDLAMTFVMPTVRFAGSTRDSVGNRNADVDEDLVHQFTMDMLTEALANNVPITSIELGNEWWVDNSAIWGENLNAVEYGRIASALAAIVQDAIDDFRSTHSLPASWVEPDIVVQVGPGGNAEWVTPAGEDLPPGYTGLRVSSTELIFKQFDTTAEQRAVDGIVLHDYTAGDIENINGYRYESFKIWDDLAARDSDFKVADRYVSEWNIKNGNETLVGLQQASGMVSMMFEMMLAQVDQATVWPVQQTTDNPLTLNTGKAGEEWLGLSVGGEAFRMMEESLQGLRAVPLKPTSSDMEVNVFGDESRMVFFIGNRTDEVSKVTLDVSGLFDDWTHVWGSLLTTDGSDPLDPNLVPVIVNLTASQVTTGGLLDVELGPYELVRIEFTLDGSGVVMVGDRGNDTLLASSASDKVIGDMGNDAVSGFAGNDTMSGADGQDWISGDAGNDVLNGDAGNDSLIGGAGNDSIFGGTGEDRLDGGDGVDVLRGGNDASADFLFGGVGNDSLFGENGADQVDGGSGTDRLYGGSNDDRLYGQGDSDWIYGDAGNDSAWGGVGNDIFYGGSGSDGLYGEDGADTLYGEDGNDQLGSGTGNDIIYAGAGNDSIWGDTGNDVLMGGSGKDRIEGGTGADQLTGEADADSLTGGGGTDWIYGGGAEDRIDGGDSDDTVYGDDGHDTLWGGSANDILYGGSGNDRLNGDGGADRMLGGSGADVFVFGASSGRDIIADFTDLDSILLQGFDKRWDRDDYMDHADQRGSDVVFDFGNSVLTIEDTTLREVRGELIFG